MSDFKLGDSVTVAGVLQRVEGPYTREGKYSNGDHYPRHWEKRDSKVPTVGVVCGKRTLQNGKVCYEADDDNGGSIPVWYCRSTQPAYLIATRLHGKHILCAPEQLTRI